MEPGNIAQILYFYH